MMVPYRSMHRIIYMLVPICKQALFKAFTLQSEVEGATQFERNSSLIFFGVIIQNVQSLAPLYFRLSFHDQVSCLYRPTLSSPAR